MDRRFQHFFHFLINKDTIIITSQFALSILHLLTPGLTLCNCIGFLCIELRCIGFHYTGLACCYIGFPALNGLPLDWLPLHCIGLFYVGFHGVALAYLHCIGLRCFALTFFKVDYTWLLYSNIYSIFGLKKSKKKCLPVVFNFTLGCKENTVYKLDKWCQVFLARGLLIQTYSNPFSVTIFTFPLCFFVNLSYFNKTSGPIYWLMDN